jgi:hypothetical protein
LSTNLQIVESALRMLTVLDADENASPEDGALGLEQLNDLFAMMIPDGIDLGYSTQDSLGDDFPLDDTTAAQIKPLLAIKLHAFYPHVQVPQSVISQATTATMQIKRASVLANMEEADLRHVPLGESNGYRANILTGE